jgi:hypothetical protein
MAGDRLRNIPSSVFTIIDLKYINMLQSFGLIRSNLLNEFIYKRPSYYAVQHMVSFFDDDVLSFGELESESSSSRKTTIAGFRKDKKSVILIWYSDRIPNDEIEWDPVDMKVKNFTFKDPVYVEMITGRVYELDKKDWNVVGNDTGFRNLPLWDSVLMIAEKSALDIQPLGR